MAEKNKTKALAVAPTPAILEALRNEFPAEQGFTQNLFPRLGMFSQDVIEGKGKTQKVVTEAGTFFTDKQSENEIEKDGKKVKEWEKEELGDSIEGIILFQRKQLRHYDESTETYTTSPVYDDESEIVPLFCNKAEVARGTPAELKARTEFQFEKEGKKRSSLEDNRILYVEYEGEIYQMSLRGSSMYSFMKYARENIVPSVVTKFSSEAMEKGKISWNKMTFEVARQLSQEECEEVFAKVQDIKAGVAEQKAFYAGKNGEQAKADKALNDF